MKFSQNCLDLIKKWEGLFLEAYPDPVKIPTIGYGTIRYPNGKDVRLGDKITKQQAEGYLQDECNGIVEPLSKLITVTVNQNQFDALVSFCYNLGVGAFQDSTLRQKLNAGDLAGAANEFDRWVFATENGVKKQLPGLVNRRKDEKDLFNKSGGEGKPIEVEKSHQDTVTWLEGYRDNEDTIVVAWNETKVVEILTLASKQKDDLISILHQYKNANNFRIAPDNKAIPAGERISVSGKARPINKVPNPPNLDRGLLERGMDDSESSGDDIKQLQQRLQDLGYYRDKLDGIFGKNTDAAVRKFQADYFGADAADGKVGPLTWGKLWGDRIPTGTPTPPPGSTTKNYLRLTKTARQDRYGCRVLTLEYIKNDKIQASLQVLSGAPSRQAFRIGSNSEGGSFEPLPEGKWKIDNIIWADGKDNYNGAIFAEGEGPVKVPLNYVAPGKTARAEILFHIDWNRSDGYPGTAGCVGLYNSADFKTLVGWLRDTDPRDLYVDWGLGTCPQPD